MRHFALFIISATLLIAIHYRVTSNPPWQFLAIGGSFGLIFLAWLKLANSRFSTLRKTILGLSLLLAFLLLDGIYLVSSVFTANGITEQAAAHLNLESLKSGGNSELMPYHYAVAAIATILVIAWISINKAESSDSSKPTRYSLIAFVLLGFTTHPGTADLSKLWWYSVQNRDMDPTIIDGLENGHISKRTLKNTLIQRSNAHKKSVILIYLESFEKAYLNQAVFPNLADNLTSLEANESTYGQFKPSFFAQHTIAGLVSSLCSVPYAATGGSTGNVINNGAGSYYMPHVQCLGDITKELGYYNAFYQGGDLSFTQKGAFFKSHGFDEVKGIHELWNDAPKTKRSSWGLHDDVLFNFARKRIDQLANRGTKQPFLFTLLTLDTHDPFGTNKTSRSCNTSNKSVYRGPKDHEIQNQIHCADYLIGEFVRDLKNTYGDSIDIYLVADHLAHAHSQGHELRTKQDRDLIFLSLNGTPSHKGERTFTHLDIAPTILDKTTGGFLSKMGLGVSVLGKRTTLLEKLGREKFDIQIRENLSALAQRYWEYPSLMDSPFVFNEELLEFSFSGTSFPSPILFKLNDSNEITSYHSFAIDQYLKASSDVGRVLSVQKCGALSIYQANPYPSSSFCLMVGDLGSKTLHIEQIESGREYSLSDFTSYLNLESNLTLLRARLFERTSVSVSAATSASSTQIKPLIETQFLAGKDSSDRMVTNVWNLSLFEKFQGFKNHKAANQDGLYFFKIHSGRVELLNISTNCSELKNSDLGSTIKNASTSEFVIMSGRNGLECHNYKSGTPFDPQISNLKPGHSLIAYLNLETDYYKYIVDEDGRKIQLNLIDEKIYSHYIN